MTATTAAANRGSALAVEVSKQFRRPRTAGIVVVSALVELCVCLLLATTGAGGPERLGDWGSVMPRSSGFALPLIALNAMNLLAFPVIAAIYAADTVASEAGFGSLRYLSARPVSRSRILAAKAAVAAGLTLATVSLAYMVSWLFGVGVFGWRRIDVVDLQHSNAFRISGSSFTPFDALLRSAAIIGVVLAATASVYAFALLLSTLTVQPFAALAGGVGFAFVSRALDNVPGLHSLSPWLPVTDASTTAWTGLLDRPVAAGPINHLLIVQGAYVAGLGAVAFLSFTRRDILS